LVYLFIYSFLISSACFGRCFHRSAGAPECIYSFWYCPLILLPAGVMDEVELHGVVDNIRSCKYS